MIWGLNFHWLFLMTNRKWWIGFGPAGSKIQTGFYLWSNQGQYIFLDCYLSASCCARISVINCARGQSISISCRARGQRILCRLLSFSVMLCANPFSDLCIFLVTCELYFLKWGFWNRRVNWICSPHHVMIQLSPISWFLSHKKMTKMTKYLAPLLRVPWGPFRFHFINFKKISSCC